MKQLNALIRLSLYVMPAIFLKNLPAQTPVPLDSILMRIEQIHPALKAPEARIRELETYAGGTVSMPAPKVGAGFWMTPYNPKRWSESGAHGEGMGSFMISGEQMFPNRKMQQAEGRYMASMSAMQTADIGVMRNMLFAEAKNAYFNYIVLKKKTAVIEESKNLLRLMLESAGERYKFNREKLGSIYKAEAEIADLDRMQAMYAGEIRLQKTMLQTLLQFSQSIDFEPDTTLFSSWRKLPAQPDTTRILARSDMLAIEAQLRTARLEQEFNRAKLKPEFGVRVDHMFAFGGQPWQFSLMGMMTVPLAPWADKDIKTKIAGIDHRINAFGLEKSALANDIRGALADRLVMMQTLQNQIERYENVIIPNQHKRFQSTLLAYGQNTEELFMVLDAWLELKMSRLAQLDMIQQLFQTKIAYEKELEIH
ncbi:MAG: TolC family protein [Chitinophagales bacterium]|nr:TolC family protein [Chitinophagales bacterium]